MKLKTLSLMLFAGTALTGANAYAAGDLNLICSADVVICEQMKGDFEKAHSDIKVNMVRLSSGETYAKIRAEARNPKTDIWWAGTGDPHLQAASENLTLEYKSPKLGELQDWAVKQAESSGYKTVGVYAGALGWGYNTDIFKAKGYKEPKCWADLLDASFKGEIQIANLVREGLATKEIASFLSVSEAAINLHRYRIRQKLGLSKSQNLQSYLSSLS